MNPGQAIEQYFSLLDAGEAEMAAQMFDSGGLINAPWENGVAPVAFIKKHLESAPIRHHRIMDVLISDSGRSAAAHFEYTSKAEDGQENPTFVDCDHFKFGQSGKIESLSVYCHAKQQTG